MMRLKLKFEEINGTNEFFSKILKGNWDSNFLVLKPGHKVTSDMFLDN